MSKAIATLIVDGGLADVAQSSRAVKHVLLEEQDFGIAQGIAPFVGDDAGDDGAGSKGEANVLGVEAGAGGYGRRVALVLMESLVRVAATARHEPVLASPQTCEEETPVG